MDHFFFFSICWKDDRVNFALTKILFQIYLKCKSTFQINYSIQYIIINVLVYYNISSKNQVNKRVNHFIIILLSLNNWLTLSYKHSIDSNTMQNHTYLKATQTPNSFEYKKYNILWLLYPSPWWSRVLSFRVLPVYSTTRALIIAWEYTLIPTHLTQCKL